MSKEVVPLDDDMEMPLIASTKAQWAVGAFFISVVPFEYVLEVLFGGMSVPTLVVGVLGASAVAGGSALLIKRVPGIGGTRINWRVLAARLLDEEIDEPLLLRRDAAATDDKQDSDKVVDADPEPPRQGYSKLHMQIGELFRPHINQVLSNRIAILGMPGAGKSNLVAKLCELLASFGVPLIIFDTKPEYSSMCDRPYFRNPLRASAKNVTPGKNGNARDFARQVMSDRLQVVLDLRSYRDDNVAAEVMIEIIESIWEYEEALKDAGKKRLPCMLVLDEAHYWLSQGQQMSNVSKKENKETGISLNTKLQATFFNLVNIGRSFGMGSIIATQRPANIDKRAIAPAEWKFLMKANQPQDITAYKEFGFGEEARKLGKGQAYIIGPGEFADGKVYQIDKRESPDEAETPGIENLEDDDDTAILPDDVDAFIDSLPVIDREDTRYLQPDNSSFTVRRSPYYAQTTYQYPPQPVYSDAGPNKTVNGSVYSPVNGSTSGYDGQQTGLLNEEINSDSEREGVSGAQLNVNETVDTSKVSAEKREFIKRLVAMKAMTHRDIAKVVKLDGPKYAIYKQVCAELGIEIK